MILGFELSDGVDESKRDSESDACRRVCAEDYGRAVAKVAVAQICEGVGFEAVKQSALVALSDIAVRYICDLGKSASSYASLAGRSEVSLFDIVKGLENLGSSGDLSGSSEVDHCVMESGVLKEMAEFVGTLEETPFALSIPQFPVIKYPRGIPKFSHMGEVPNGRHIPPWLPAFPDPHTYIQSPIWKERKTDPRTDKVEQVRQRRKAERSLLSLQQRLLSNSLAGSSGSGNYCVNAVKDSGASTSSNTFLAPLLPVGEKDVSTFLFPSKLANEEAEKKQVSVLETFSPAIDAMKGAESYSLNLYQRVVSERRPVHFKLKAVKKMLVEDLDVNLRSRANERRSSSSGRDDEKDDKKRRVELILRQSMENPQELSQM
uniref:Transcription initiation factor TFIID subunit 8 n=1 Tax=Opuntia streptacantha TaxID=393608 RepID=A0A7C9DVN2_OPUST